MQILQTSIAFIPNIGPKKAEWLQKELGIFTFRDMLLHFPFRYIDRSQIQKISTLVNDNDWVQICGKAVEKYSLGEKQKKRWMATLQDDTGNIDLVWFRGGDTIFKYLQIGETYIVYGKTNVFKGEVSLSHPEFETYEEFKKNGILWQSVYPLTEFLRNRYIDAQFFTRCIKFIWSKLSSEDLVEYLPDVYLNKYKIVSRSKAYFHIHLPNTIEQINEATYRIKFDELFWIQLPQCLLNIHRKKSYKGLVFSNIQNHFKSFYDNHLPFELTDAQKNVIKEIRKDLTSGKQMNRLLQGDVGSGKTIVALLCMLMAIDNDSQACLMAPTEILAQQHFESIVALLQAMPIQVCLLTGAMSSAHKKEIKQALLNGHIHIVIGTHALIEDSVQFANLGLAIIDEQHRFGVAQRAKLWKGKTIPPHVLVMTATPIPRTLAMTLWGDLDISIVNSLPPGRTPIKTYHYYESKRLALFQFLHQKIKEGQQVYIVYPLIEESETLDLLDLTEGHNAICREFPQYQVGVVHGKMKTNDKEISMQLFKENKLQILVATTVIEVGVNVPNATIMVIENAERFGLSQLHQLRGRVGRGSNESFCFLMSKVELSKESKERLRTMCETTDGFVIAEKDLQLRGPGNMFGTQQSGLAQLKLTNLKTDTAILEKAREVATTIATEDPQLTKPEHAQLKRIYEQGVTKQNWVDIS